MISRSEMRNVPLLFAVVTCSIMLLTLPRPASAQTEVYDLPSYDVLIQATPDGSLHLSESITYYFASGSYLGNFNYQRWIPDEGFDSLQNVSVQDSLGNPLPFHEYYSTSYGGLYNITWSGGPVASPAVRTYHINYTVTNALTEPSNSQNGVDWNVVGQYWLVPILNLTTRVYVPRSVATSPSFSYSPNGATVSETGGLTSVRFTYADLPPRQGYTVVVYFPKIVDVSISPLRILRDSPFAGGITFAGMCGVMVGIWYFKGRDPKVERVGPSPTLPSERPPGEAGCLVSQGFGIPEFQATLIDLASRSKVKIIQSSPKDVSFEVTDSATSGKSDRQLRDYESLVLGALAKAGTASNLKWHLTLFPFKKMLFRELTSERVFFVDPGKVVWRYTVPGLLVFFGGFVASFAIDAAYPHLGTALKGVLFGVALGGASVGFVSNKMPRRTAAGALERARWNAYLDNLKMTVESLAKSEPEEAMTLFADKFAWFPLVKSLRGRGYPSWLKKISGEIGQHGYSPVWYVSQGTHGTPGSTVALAVDFATFVDNFSAALGHLYVNRKTGFVR